MQAHRPRPATRRMAAAAAAVQHGPSPAAGGVPPAAIDLRGVLARMKRRMLAMVACALVVFAVCAAVVYSLVPVYRSTASILVEEPDLSAEGKAGSGESAAQHIQTVTRRVMTRANLLRIAREHDLVKRVGGAESEEATVEALRRVIALEIVSADSDARNVAKSSAPIAFTIAFESTSPETARQVAGRLADLYLSENAQSRQKRAAEAASFLADEANARMVRINEIEAKLAQFKQRNLARLPEWQALNIQLRDRAENDLQDTERQIRALGERRVFLEGQLAQLKPNTPAYNAIGERVVDPEDRLRQLEDRLASARAVYSPQHPDVVKLSREVEALSRNAPAAPPRTGALAAEVARVQADLDAARERYSGAHPDVIRLEKSLASLRQQLAEAEGAANAGPPARARQPENPAYVAIQSQLDATRNEIRVLRAKQDQLKARSGEIGARLAQTPQVEREYLELSRERDNELRRYQEIRARQMEAQTAQELENDRKGERFSLIEPAALPERPYRPNRRAMLIVSFVLAIGAGLGWGGLLESLDHTVRGAAALNRITGAAVLAGIPSIMTPRVRRRRSAVRLAAAALAAVALIVAAFEVARQSPDTLTAMIARLHS